MSESRTKKQLNTRLESPYQRIGILLLAILLVLGLIFVVNLVARGLGGNEAKLMQAVMMTLKEPRINGQLSLAQQAQANTFDMKGTFSIEKLKKISLDGEVNGAYQNEQLKIPVKAYMNLDQHVTFLNVANAAKVADVIGANAPTIKDDLSSLAHKVDGKWVRIQQQANTSNTCTSELFAKLSRDQDAAKQVAGIFANNRFLSVEGVVQKDDTTQEYTVRYDEEAMTGFIKSLKATEFFKSTKSCNDTFDPLGTEATSAAKATTPQASQKASQQAKVTTKMTVRDDRVRDIVVVSSLNNQVNTTRVSLDFKSGTPLAAPASDIVESAAIQQEISSLGKIFQQQQGSLNTGGLQ